MTEEDDFRYWVLFNMRKPLKDNCITSQLLANDERKFVRWKFGMPVQVQYKWKNQFYTLWYQRSPKLYPDSDLKMFLHLRYAFGSYVDE